MSRIQLTPDMLPGDVLGVTVWDQQKSEFVFKPGPIFSNIILADEINRTTPRTQSALLEAMNEAQVSIDGHTRKLIQPFIVIATQNPFEHHGTYPLPETQLDRLRASHRHGISAARQRARNHAAARQRAQRRGRSHPVMEARKSKSCSAPSRKCALTTACGTTPSTSSNEPAIPLLHAG